jgi:hypothetical protein
VRETFQVTHTKMCVLQLATRCASLLDTVMSALFEAILTSFVANLPSIECFDAAGA